MKPVVLAGAMALLLVGIVGCKDSSPTSTENGNQPPPDKVTTCLDCHSSEANLKLSLGQTKADVPLVLSGDG